MNYTGKIIVYGFMLWLMVFVTSILIYPLKETDPAFFETLMAIALSAFTVFCGVFFFKRGKIRLKTCMAAGFSWMLINILIDLPLFSWGPMKMDLSDYVTDIGLTYLVIPVILSAFAYRRR